ncbi:hypothetical protein FQA39_LY18812 [Lamprigera yunnana]|nr:hypothetical protein FQA39_LY18812 [Lamprigera yunnana]
MELLLILKFFILIAPIFGYRELISTRGQRIVNDLKEGKESLSEFLYRNNLSTPEQCARTCTGGPPKKCYYKFHLEQYNVQGIACTACRPNATNACQCIVGDGIEKSAYTVNRLIPGPSIEVCGNDTVIVDVENHIPGASVTIHWHGILQRNSQHYDGVPFVTQCPILEDTSFRYQWLASNVGSHFWHSHTGFQKMDGLTGRIIVREQKSNDPHRLLYDYDLSEHVIFLQDWAHEYVQEKFPGRNAGKIHQIPDNILINGRGKYKHPSNNTFTNVPLERFNVTYNYRYKFRLINAFASVCPTQISVEKHPLTIIATDGHPIEPIVVDSIMSVSAERFDFIITANQLQGGAFWIQVKALEECGPPYKVQQLAILQYFTGSKIPLRLEPTYDASLPLGKVLNPLDPRCDGSQLSAVCISQLKSVEIKQTDVLKTVPDVKIFLPFKFYFHDPNQLFRFNSQDRYFTPVINATLTGLLDNITYVSPPSPLLSQYADLDSKHFCNGDQNIINCGTTCQCTHVVKIPLNAVVELILVDEVHLEGIHHPFHLHGFSYHVLGLAKMPIPGKNITLQEAVMLDRLNLLRRNFQKPPSKDTVMIPSNGYVVLRFKADNVGFWFFHCHFLLHIISGMSAVFQVGEVGQMPLPPVGFPKCGNFLPKI